MNRPRDRASRPDPLASLLQRVRVEASLHFSGSLCGVTSFTAQPGRAFLHVLRRGAMTARHHAADGSLVELAIDEPTLLFYPRPLAHTFVNTPADGSEFVCAALDFEGGAAHPLLQTLPAAVRIPLDAVPGLDPLLRLLGAEVDDARSGWGLAADRLLEVLLIHLLRWMLEHADELGIRAGLLAGLADPVLAPVLARLHEHPAEAWSLPAMADAAQLSRSAFASRFRRVVGISPAAYLAEWRIALAQGRLRAGAAVAEVAAELGYSSASAFSRAFSARTGRSPREWASRAQPRPSR